MHGGLTVRRITVVQIDKERQRAVQATIKTQIYKPQERHTHKERERERERQRDSEEQKRDNNLS